MPGSHLNLQLRLGQASVPPQETLEATYRRLGVLVHPKATFVIRIHPAARALVPGGGFKSPSPVPYSEVSHLGVGSGFTVSGWTVALKIVEIRSNMSRGRLRGGTLCLGLP